MSHLAAEEGFGPWFFAHIVFSPRAAESGDRHLSLAFKRPQRSRCLSPVSEGAAWMFPADLNFKPSNPHASKASCAPACRWR